ncbi:isochorismatase family protein [Candidatus Woesearchaeota archaeon]|mgnify:CR=1 FL=1|jgi:nicotinamidase/pyrazinamidase|nr:isochorismatase family protein [Candidatus Woesearchaeota archaeon]MBT6519068.1 isochorismatase family protein [Candidatus Woesearchaeota archaeon]MBT7366868.1 isochorismatase family protein [Candidatus Woesearchaeota archaeon]
MNAENKYENLIFYDVDTQKDFMNRDGALFISALEEATESDVPYGAEKIKPNLALLENYRTEKGIRKMGSRDRHFPHDLELSRVGGPFPDHCMDKTEGLERISETTTDAVYLEHKIGEEECGRAIYKNYSELELEEIAASGKNIIFEKQHYDVFTNPATEKVIAGADVKKAIVYGVATDYCDRAAVIGMLERGVEVYFVIDAAKEVNINFQGEVDMLFGRNAIAEMVEAGAKPITTENVLAEMYLRH